MSPAAFAGTATAEARRVLDPHILAFHVQHRRLEMTRSPDDQITKFAMVWCAAGAQERRVSGKFSSVLRLTVIGAFDSNARSQMGRIAQASLANALPLALESHTVAT